MNPEKSAMITMKVSPELKDYLIQKAKENKVNLSEYITKKVAPEYFQKKLDIIAHS